jgi:hypothetical protein
LLHPHKPGQRARNLDRRRPPDDGVIILIQGYCPRRHALPHAERNESTRVPERRKPALPAFPLFPPSLLHDLIGNIPRGLRPEDRRKPFVQGGRENAAGNQSLFLLGVTFQTAGNEPRHGPVAVAHKHLFAAPNDLDMGAEVRFQIADIDGPHIPIIANVTMLEIVIFLPGMGRAEEQFSASVGGIPCSLSPGAAQLEVGGPDPLGFGWPSLCTRVAQT